MALVSYKTLGQVRSGWATKRLVAVSRVVTSNVVTITSATDHGLVTGDRVFVSGAGASLDGLHVVAAVGSTTTFSYPTTSGNVASATLASAYFQGMKTDLTSISVTTVVRASNILTVTTDVTHGISENEYVYVEAGVTNATGLFQVLDVPTTTTFRVVSFNAALGSTAYAANSGNASVSRSIAQTVYQPAAGKSGLISSLVLFNATEQNVVVDLYQTPSTAWTSLAQKDKYLIQGVVTLAPKETYSVNLAITIANQERIVMCADTPGVQALAYGTEFE